MKTARLAMLDESPLSLEVLRESAGQWIVARQIYPQGTRYEVVIQPSACEGTDLLEAMAVLPHGVTVQGGEPSACLGDRGEVILYFWAWRDDCHRD